MIFSKLVSLSLLAAPILATPLAYSSAEGHLSKRLLDSTDTVKDVLDEVVDKTDALTQAVQAFTGNVADAAPILEASTALQTTIINGAAEISEQRRLTLIGVLAVLPNVVKLNNAVEGVSRAIIRQKPLADQAGLTEIVLSQLQDQQKAADSLVAALIDKLPPLVPDSVGEILSSPATKSLELAIRVYSPR